MRKSQSSTVLYGDGAPDALHLDQLQLHDSSNVYQQLDGLAPQRLLVVANRLPVSAFKDRAGRWQLQVSAGGLVSALMGVSNIETKWIGWPGGCTGSGAGGARGACVLLVVCCCCAPATCCSWCNRCTTSPAA